MSLIRRLLGQSNAVEIENQTLFDLVQAEMTSVEKYANSHGGSIELVNVSESGQVQLRLKGACKSCPMSSLTIRNGVEEVLKAKIPDVHSVITVD